MLKRAFFVVLAIQCMTTIATPAMAESQAMRDLNNRITILEGKITTLENQVTALQGAAVGPKTYTVPFQYFLMEWPFKQTLLDVPGKMRVTGYCDANSPYIEVTAGDILTGGSNSGLIVYNEVARPGIWEPAAFNLVPKFAYHFAYIYPNADNALLYVQAHVVLMGTGENLAFWVIGIPGSGGSCGYAAQATVLPN